MISTSIKFVLVAVIARFILLTNSITTVWLLAFIRAFIIVNIVGIVAAFPITVNETIATASGNTARNTVVVILRVPIITGFKAQL
tara:strand:- start:120 stop:374 length:255 start_codon:yes stop_codon:yes gene_type:complete